MLGNSFLCSEAQFANLIDELKNQGYALFGPKVKDEVIVYDRIEGAHELPIGYEDEQAPGTYRLKRRKERAYFTYYHTSPHSWKKFLCPTEEVLWKGEKDEKGVYSFEEPPLSSEKMAFIGVLACDLQAIHVLDRVYDTRIERYKQYWRRRKNSFTLAVNCTTSVSTCFCASMGSGPKARGDFDLSVTEVLGKEITFIIECGSSLGEALVAKLKLRKASDKEHDGAMDAIEKNAKGQGEQVQNLKLHDILAASLYAKRWEHVAKRCINCANCTMSCPTCFCTTVEDVLSLDGKSTTRVQKWESCFTLGHSYVHGGSVRPSALSRYRQWLTHKFGTWWDQFGVSGCTGCGRCIAWCPVGIDVREELNSIEEECHEEHR